MTELDLDALEALASAATEGPWERSFARSIESNRGNGEWRVVVDQMPDGVGAGVIEPADAEFIAAAREAVPALIARVRELERQRNAATVRASELERQRDAVLLALHTSVTNDRRDGWLGAPFESCRECSSGWPCATVRALTERSTT